MTRSADDVKNSISVAYSIQHSSGFLNPKQGDKSRGDPSSLISTIPMPGKPSKTYLYFSDKLLGSEPGFEAIEINDEFIKKFKTVIDFKNKDFERYTKVGLGNNEKEAKKLLNNASLG